MTDNFTRDPLGRFAEGISAGMGGELLPEDEVSGPDQAWEAVNAAYDPAVSNETLAQMLADSASVASRLAAARVPSPGVARVASYDTDPLVRALAQSNGYDLAPEDQARLDRDPEVAQVLAVLAGPDRR